MKDEVLNALKKIKNSVYSKDEEYLQKEFTLLEGAVLKSFENEFKAKNFDTVSALHDIFLKENAKLYKALDKACDEIMTQNQTHKNNGNIWMDKWTKEEWKAWALREVKEDE